MTTRSGNQTRGERIPAIERATNRPWNEWVAYFDSHGARTLDHPAIARLARPEMPADLDSPDWWAQGVAIAYEQFVGLRVPGQSSTGTFRVSASRTLPVDRDTALGLWLAAHDATTEHLGHAVEDRRSSRTEKRSFRRFSLEGAGKVEVAATAGKDPAKTILSVSQDGLPDGERIEEWRAHWKALLKAL
ncbi:MULTISPECIES: hypothetical protein [unclassified Leucobacter]|uniref:hypothetical protein n=1 Tax=unclassified Leucobacter TaxID=2621730 RepID=UPI00165D80E7|nr:MULTISPECIES: hypothetical protein [unclassified Leucobacter]MBC9937547.1 hypothetical protein [Leucobacter sp. cx-87]